MTLSPAGIFLLPAVGLEPGWEFSACPPVPDVIAFPQLGQKLASAVIWLPQFGQYCILDAGEPHLEQNLSPDWTGEPHLAQFIRHLTSWEYIDGQAVFFWLLVNNDTIFNKTDKWYLEIYLRVLPRV
jgi:hypothetical protein